MQNTPKRNRSIALSRVIRSIYVQRDASAKGLGEATGDFRRKLRRWELGGREPSFSSFLDLMTLLRCEVLLVPLGSRTGQFTVLNELPTNDGEVVRFPDEVCRREGRRQRVE